MPSHRLFAVGARRRRAWRLVLLIAAAPACVAAIARENADGSTGSPARYDWPCFLGPNHDGTSRETGLNKNFAQHPPALLWSAPRGTSLSSPAVADGRVIMLHRVADEEVVDCFDAATGQRIWRHTYPTDYTDRYGFSNGPRSTPAIHNGRVYTLGVQDQLRCLSLADGSLVWKRNLFAEFKLRQEYFGCGTSPVVEGDNLIVNVGADGGPCVVAFNLDTGAVAWKSGADWGQSYATPLPATIRGKRRLLVFAGGDSRPPTGGLLIIDPAGGTLISRFSFRGKRYESVNAASPVAFGDSVFLTTAYRTGGICLNLADDRKPEVVWKTDELNAHWATPIHDRGYLYGVDGSSKGNASIVCLDAETGKLIWRTAPEWTERIATKTGHKEATLTPMRCSLLRVDGAYLCLGEMGTLLWLDLSPKGCRVLSRERLFTANETWTPPAISRGLLYVTQNTKSLDGTSEPRLLCYDLRRPATQNE